MICKIALVQADFYFGELQANLNKAAMLIRDAAKQGANIICLPESFNQGYNGAKMQSLNHFAETIDGQTLTLMQALAKELNVYLIAPIFIRHANGIFNNSAFLISDQGQIIGSYAKTHPIEIEKGMFTPGNSYPVFVTKYGIIGIIICNDLRFMETGRLLGIQKADMIFVPSAWRFLGDNNDEWELMLRSHAINNRALVAATNRVGSANDLFFAGETLIVDPNGYLLQKCNGNDEQILIQEYDLNDIRAAKAAAQDIFKDRKPLEYDLITKP